MNEATIDRMMRLALGSAGASGYTLSDAAAYALRDWIRGLEGRVPDSEIPEQVERLVDAMVLRAGDDKTLGVADFYAAAAVLAEKEESSGTRDRFNSVTIDGLPLDDRFSLSRDVEEAPPPRAGWARSAPPPPSPPASAAPAGGFGMAEAAPPDFSVDFSPDFSTLESAAPAGAAAAAAPDAKPAPRTAYALLDAPETVVAQVEFEVTVGLAEKQSAGVIGDALVLPASTVYPYTLALQLVAEGFELVDGGAWDREVVATEAAPYPSTVFRLRALAQAETVHARALKVLYSVGGQTIGFAVRPVAVVRTPADLAAAPPGEKPPSVDMAVPTDLRAPDLTIHILRDDEIADRLLWKLQSPHPGVAGPSDAPPPSCRIGNEPKEFAKQLIKQVNQRQGKALHRYMRGTAMELADVVPRAVWDAVHAAAKAAGGPPTILILSEEPYVPWELAYVPEPRPDAAAPGYLGAQARVGRWVLGQANPPFPPPSELGVASMAVVWGEYDGSRWDKLEAAREEAEALHQEYGAVRIDATMDPVMECIDGTPPAQALHFAIHGIYNPGSLEDGLILTDEQPVTFFDVRAGSLPQRPLVFLNACQVGAGQQFLGDYAGIASAFLDIKASAVIAPLWSVNDVIAKDISLSFYREAFAGEPVAAVLRRVRARTGAEEAATFLAYQFFGHPELKLTRSTP